MDYEFLTAFGQPDVTKLIREAPDDDGPLRFTPLWMKEDSHSGNKHNPMPHRKGYLLSIAENQ